jgi:hypothetical protein
MFDEDNENEFANLVIEIKITNNAFFHSSKLTNYMQQLITGLLFVV